MIGDNYNKKGFTLVEVLISASIFAIIVTGFLNLFSSAFNYQRENLDQAYLLNHSSYVTEYITRAIRLARKDKNGDCIGKNQNYEIISGSITFLNDRGKCQEFRLVNGIIEVGIAPDTFPPYQFMDLTPSDMNVETFDFSITGGSQTDDLQPRVTMLLVMKTTGSEVKAIDLQTTISQRELDVEY